MKFHHKERERVKEAFSGAAAEYDSYALLQKEVGERLFDRIDVDRKEKRLLEIGSGTGRLSKRLARRCPSSTVISLDIAPGMIRAFRSSPGVPANVRFLRGDAEDLPLPSSSVDLVLSNMALQWTEGEVAFKEIFRVLKKGGFFLSPSS